jgi:hypothetical protein
MVPDPFEYAVESALRQKRQMAHDQFKLAKFFARTFIGFCIGGIYFAAKIGALAFGIAWAICAILVIALVNSSRVVSADADRLEVYAADRSDEGRERILKELGRPQDEGSSTGVSAFREAILNAKTQ